MNTLRILIADDHPIVRRGLRADLSENPGWEVVAEAGNGRDAVALAREHQPHLAVLDLSMPELNGLEATRQIKACSPGTQVMILTMHESEELAREALQAGARGFLLKKEPPSVLRQGAESVARGEPFFSGPVGKMVLAGFLDAETRGRPTDRTGNELTSREREVLQGVAEGKGSKEIATQLGIETKTVEHHRASVMRKLKLQSVAALVRYAIRNGIIEA
jgi:DNA-binding NarL/FixJ family response regulator